MLAQTGASGAGSTQTLAWQTVSALSGRTFPPRRWLPFQALAPPLCKALASQQNVRRRPLLPQLLQPALRALAFCCGCSKSGARASTLCPGTQGEGYPGVGPEARVLAVLRGPGGTHIVDALRRQSAVDILALSDAPEPLQQLREAHGQGDPLGGPLGNERGLRLWQGPLASLPAYQGPFHAVVFGGGLGGPDARGDLLAAALLLRPGGHVCIVHPEGRRGLAAESGSDAAQPVLPTQEELSRLAADLPLASRGHCDEPHSYRAVLQVPEGYAFARAPLPLEGRVVRGFGRGSAQMGFPTANLDPADVGAAIQDLPLGVYFGWAQLDPGAAAGPGDGGVHPAAVNIGRRPSLADSSAAVTIEAHVAHGFAGPFYGARMRLLLLGFLRPEMKFGGLPALVARIQTDVGLSKVQLKTERHTRFQGDPFFQRSWD